MAVTAAEPSSPLCTLNRDRARLALFLCSAREVGDHSTLARVAGLLRANIFQTRQLLEDFDSPAVEPIRESLARASELVDSLASEKALTAGRKKADFPVTPNDNSEDTSLWT